MDVDFLRTFLVVQECRSAAEAARRLGITSAAVAQRMKALEAELGTPLVKRAGRSTVATDAGSAIIALATSLVRDAEQLRARATRDNFAGEVRIGAITTALTGILPPILKDLMIVAPELRIFLRPGNSPDLYEAVMRGELDAALIVEPPYSLPKTCSWTTIRSEDLVLISHANLKACGVVELLTNQPFLRYDRTTWGGRIADQYLKSTRINPREVLELDSLEAISVMVSHGLGVSIVPDWADPWPAALTLYKHRLSADAPKRGIGFLAHRGSRRQHLLSLLSRLLSG